MRHCLVDSSVERRADGCDPLNMGRSQSSRSDILVMFTQVAATEIKVCFSRDFWTSVVSRLAINETAVRRILQNRALKVGRLRDQALNGCVAG